MKELNTNIPKTGKFTRAAILAMALSGMITLEGANLILLRTSPEAAPFTQEEFLNAQKNFPAQKSASSTDDVLLASTSGSAKSNKSKQLKSCLKEINKAKEKSQTYTIISVDDNGTSGIEAVLKNNTTGKKLKMIDDNGDYEFDRLTTMDGTDIPVSPQDLTIVNLQETIDDIRMVEPPVVIYGGPSMFDPDVYLVDPSDPDAPNIIEE